MKFDIKFLIKGKFWLSLIFFACSYYIFKYVKSANNVVNQIFLLIAVVLIALGLYNFISSLFTRNAHTIKLENEIIQDFQTTINDPEVRNDKKLVEILNKNMNLLEEHKVSINTLNLRPELAVYSRDRGFKLPQAVDKLLSGIEAKKGAKNIFRIM